MKIDPFALLCSAIIYHCDLSELNPEPKVFREVEVKGVKQEDFQTNQVILYLPRFFPLLLLSLVLSHKDAEFPQSHLPEMSMCVCVCEQLFSDETNIDVKALK